MIAEGGRLRQERIERGLSLREAARLQGITPTELGQIERGLRSSKAGA